MQKPLISAAAEMVVSCLLRLLPQALANINVLGNGEVAKKLKEATAALDAGTYIAPNKTTVAQWMDTWQAEYLGAVKSSTISSYEATIKNHIKPCLGSIKLESLTTQDIQEFYNARQKGDETRSPLLPKPPRTSTVSCTRLFSRPCSTD